MMLHKRMAQTNLSGDTVDALIIMITNDYFYFDVILIRI